MIWVVRMVGMGLVMNLSFSPWDQRACLLVLLHVDEVIYTHQAGMVYRVLEKIGEWKVERSSK